MLRAPVDTNVFVSSNISSYENGSSRQVVQAIFARCFELLLSDETLFELAFVLNLPESRAKTKMSHSDVADYCASLRAIGVIIESPPAFSWPTVRDHTDRKFLDLAVAGDADYFVTNDHRHLVTLKKAIRTKIVTPHKFMLALNRKSRP